MSTKKAVFVTVAMTAMTVIIMVCMLLLDLKIAFFAIVGVFCGVGMSKAAIGLCTWLSEKPEKEPASLEPVVVGERELCEEAPEGVTETVEQIMEEMRNG